MSGVGGEGDGLLLHLLVVGLIIEVEGDLLDLSHILAVELVLLQGLEAVQLLGQVADIGLLLVPAVEVIAVLLLGLPELIPHILGGEIFGGGLITNMIVHGILVPHHADDVGPAVDGDAVAQLMVGVAFLVLVPAAVVVPALILVADGKLVGGVVIRNIQLGQGIAGPGAGVTQRDALIRFLGVAVAVDDQVDLLLERVGHTVTILVIAPQGIDIDIKVLVVGVGGIGIDGYLGHRFRHTVTVSKAIDSFVRFGSPADKHDILTVHIAVGRDLITQFIGLRDLLVPLHGGLGGIDAAVYVVHQVIGHMDLGNAILVRRFHHSVKVGYANRARLPADSHTVEVLIRDALSGLRELVVDDKVLLIVAPAIRGILFVGGLSAEITELDLLHILPWECRLKNLPQHAIGIHHMINTGDIRIILCILGGPGDGSFAYITEKLTHTLVREAFFIERIGRPINSGCPIDKVLALRGSYSGDRIRIFLASKEHKLPVGIFLILIILIRPTIRPSSSAIIKDHRDGINGLLIVGHAIVVFVLGPGGVDRNVRI